MSETIAVVIVTYNRKKFLLECLASIRNQSHKPDVIYIIDNLSTDGTPEFLLDNKYIPKLPVSDLKKNQLINYKISSILKPEESININYVRKFENDGGAGGFYLGIKLAYEDGFDWIWCMDDDVIPDKNCLLEMVKVASDISNKFDVLQPDRIWGNNLEFHWNYGSKINLTNPFKPLGSSSVNVTDFPKENVINIVSFPFEGPMFKRKVIETIGNVDIRFFINYDDADYSMRVIQAGFKIGLVSKSFMIKKLWTPQKGVTLDFRLYYSVRNLIILERKYCNIFIVILRNIYRVISTLLVFTKQGLEQNKIKLTFEAYKIVVKACYDGFIFRI